MSQIPSFFQVLGLSKSKSEEAFIRIGLKKFGTSFGEIMDIIVARADGANFDPYEKKNASLEMSLYIDQFFNYEKWMEIFSWLERENFSSPKTVLDLGCENGVTTCLLALLWPDAEVIGVDMSANAIKCANELANKAKISNVRFILGGADDMLLASGNKDIIFSSMFTHEWLRKDGISPLINHIVPDTIEEISVKENDLSFVKSIQLVKNALAPNGFFVSVDRIPQLHGLWWYVQAIETANLKVSIGRSYRIDVVQTDQNESFPVTVARHTSVNDSKTSLSEVLSLGTFRHVPNLDLYDDIAEIFFRSLAKEICLFESTITYFDGSGVRRLSLYKSDSLLITFDSTDRGYRNLVTNSLVVLPEKIRECQSIVEDLKGVAEVNTIITEAGSKILRDWGF